MPERGPVRKINDPQPGHWMVRLVRDGPEVPAKIERIDHEPGNPANKLDTGPVMFALIAGEPVDPLAIWHSRGRPIDAVEYAYQLADYLWCRDHAPDEPKANPRAPIDPLSGKLPF
jgi:hypothetical protein